MVGLPSRPNPPYSSSEAGPRPLCESSFPSRLTAARLFLQNAGITPLAIMEAVTVQMGRRGAFPGDASPGNISGRGVTSQRNSEFSLTHVHSVVPFLGLEGRLLRVGVVAHAELGMQSIALRFTEPLPIVGALLAATALGRMTTFSPEILSKLVHHFVNGDSGEFVSRRTIPHEIKVRETLAAISEHTATLRDLNVDALLSACLERKLLIDIPELCDWTKAGIIARTPFISAHFCDPRDGKMGLRTLQPHIYHGFEYNSGLGGILTEIIASSSSTSMARWCGGNLDQISLTDQHCRALLYGCQSSFPRRLTDLSFKIEALRRIQKLSAPQRATIDQIENALNYANRVITTFAKVGFREPDLRFLVPPSERPSTKIPIPQMHATVQSLQKFESALLQARDGARSFRRYLLVHPKLYAQTASPSAHVLLAHVIVGIETELVALNEKRRELLPNAFSAPSGPPGALL